MIQKMRLQGILKPFIWFATGLFLVILCGKLQAQEYNSDSLFSAKLMEDNLQLYNQVDSLDKRLAGVLREKKQLQQQSDSLSEVILNLESGYLELKTMHDSLLLDQISLNRSILMLRQEALKTNERMEEQLRQLREKEFQLAKSELELKELKSSAEINQVKLEGKLDVHNTRLESKNNEIAYLKESIKEKDQQISQKNRELSAFYQEKDESLRIIDSLARALNKKELEYIRVSERLKIIESQYNEIVAKQTAAANKKKKIRFIQGVGLKSYRTPDWQLAPESASSTNTYVISNKNSGKIEFDYITGISLSLYDLSREDSKFTYDAGLFVGFGGQNLFKNFYLGPSFKIFDFFHLNAGVNFAEYQQLKTGFVEGDPLPVGWSISTITVKEWKTNVYFGFTIDLELLSTIPKKF